MNSIRRHRGFTLIEVLIVVVIMAVLAATIIPQFASSTKDAKLSTLKFNQQSLRSQIDMYKTNHVGTYPPIVSGSLPGLLFCSDANGNMASPASTIADGTHIYGPYVNNQALPTNPFDGTTTVTAVATAGAVPTTTVSPAQGWQYDVTTGGLFPNNPEYFALTNGQTAGEGANDAITNK
jgi:prepilin-type N-terminal cleavage/methylation domain-containing protein